MFYFHIVTKGKILKFSLTGIRHTRAESIFQSLIVFGRMFHYCWWRSKFHPKIRYRLISTPFQIPWHFYCIYITYCLLASTISYSYNHKKSTAMWCRRKHACKSNIEELKVLANKMLSKSKPRVFNVFVMLYYFFLLITPTASSNNGL